MCKNQHEKLEHSAETWAKENKGKFLNALIKQKGEKAEQTLTLYSPIDSTANQQQFIICQLTLHSTTPISVSEK